MEKLSRRDLGRMLLVAPIASTLRADEKEKQEPTPIAEFIASHESNLSQAERDRLKKDVTQADAILSQIRDFQVGWDVEPAIRFRAMKSRGR